LLKISEIQIKNFRAFSGAPTTINLPRGENLIVFGENGSGKSSLFHALKNFFESIPKSLSITDHPYKNFLAEDHADVYVKLKFMPPATSPRATPTAIPTRTLKLDYEWSNHTNDSLYLARQGLDVTKGFIDYKDLLQTYFLQQKADSVNVFDFLLENVLEDVKVLSGAQTFGESWKVITDLQKSIIEAQKLFDQTRDKRTKAARALKTRRDCHTRKA
jgi:predicted ATP-dependent endonuclease of OLD family